MLRMSREQLVAELGRAQQAKALIVWLVDRYATAAPAAAAAGLFFLSRFVHGLVAGRVVSVGKVDNSTARAVIGEFFDTSTGAVVEPPPASIEVHPDFKPACGSSSVLTPADPKCWHCAELAALRIGPEYMCSKHERAPLEGERAHRKGEIGFLNPCLCDRCSSSAAGEPAELEMAGACQKCGGRASMAPLCLHCFALELGALVALVDVAELELERRRGAVGIGAPPAAVGLHLAVRALRAELERTKAQLGSGPGKLHFWRWAAVTHRA
jgi:hypothetical protein